MAQAQVATQAAQTVISQAPVATTGEPSLADVLGQLDAYNG